MLMHAELSFFLEMIENRKEEIKKAIICGADIRGDSGFRRQLDELCRLAEACGYSCEGELTQRLDAENNATCLGPGKISEISELIETEDADTVIFLNPLSPSQLANLTELLDAEVLDKTDLILRIFEERARTSEAKMQVEYARLGYMLPRLRGLRKNLSRQGGTGGSMSNKGSGEKQIELDRRVIEKRMSELRKRLEQIERDRQQRRKRRAGSGLPLVSLAGYTNAGKSTLLNKLVEMYGSDSDKKVEQKDMLFVTLDTSTRRICPRDHRDFLLSDTVGFIEGLPHELVKAFRSTLSEIAASDLILHVTDCSDEEHGRHMEVTEETLKDISASDIPVIYVMNKADLSYEEAELPIVMGDRIFMSAAKGIGVEQLCDMISERLSGELISCELMIPYRASELEHFVSVNGEIEKKDYTRDGIEISCRIGRRYLKRIKEYIRL